MAKETVGASVEIEYKSIGEMRKALKEGQSEVIRLQQQFGATSQEALNAAKRVADLKDRIQEARETVDLFDPGNKFKALTGTVQVAAQGFTALQGAMGLLGVESKEVEKQLLRVQSAMALSQSLSALADSRKEFARLGALIKGPIIKAFTTLRGALIATGIGALAVAIGLVIANFEKIKETLFNVFPGLKALTNTVGNLIQKFTDFVGITSEAERTLNKVTAANNRLMESLDAEIKLLEAQGGKEDVIYKKKKDRVETELNTLRDALKTKGSLNEEELKKFRELQLQQKILDIQESKRLKEKSEKEKQQIDKDNKERLDKQKQAAQASAEAERNRIKSLEDLIIGYLEKIEDLETKSEEDRIQLKRTRAIQRMQELGATEEQMMALQVYYDKLLEQEREKQRLAEEERKKEQDEKEAERKRVASEKEIEMLKKAHENRLRMERENNEKLIMAEQSLQNAKFQAASAGLDLIAALAGRNEKLANVMFAVQKALEIGRIIMETSRGIVSAKAGLAAVPPFIGAVPNPAFFAAVPIVAKQIAALKIAAGVGIANIAAQAIGRFSRGASFGAAGGGIGGVSTAAPMQPQLPTTAQAQLVNAQAINQQGNQAVQAFVLNSDIQNNNQINAFLQRNASI